MRSELRQLTRRRRLAIEGLEQRRVLAAAIINEFHSEPLFGSEDQDQFLEIRGEPNASLQAGTTLPDITVRVSDGADLTAKTVVTVNETDVNAPPTLVQPIADKTAEVGEPFSFTIPAGTFIDQDPGDSIRYVMTTAAGFSLPAWLSFDASSGTLSGTPTKANVGALSVKLTALDQLNASSSDVFDIDVEIRPAAPWHNFQQIEDVNQDSFVSPVDALMVISYLNSGKSPQVPSDAKAEHGMLDVNGDNFVTPIDALIIINRLNQSGAEGEAQQPNMADAEELGLLDERFEGKRRKSEELLWILAADQLVSK